jgi:hypothetical protein
MHKNREFKVVVNRCDTCNDRIICAEDVESYIDMLQEIDDSYESSYDKLEPRLLLCELPK